VIVGGINTVIGVVTFPILYFLFKGTELHYMAVLVLSQFLCVTSAFITNKYLVFRTSGNPLHEYLRFGAFYWIYFASNLLLLPIAVEVLKVNTVVAQVIISVAIVIISFYWHSAVTFRKEE
jgi:putative flippase GtrA